MPWHLLGLSLLFLHLYPFVTSSTSNTPGPSPDLVPSNDLGLIFSHQLIKRENLVIIHFDVNNSTLSAYRYYYFDLRSFGYPTRSDYLPRQRLIDTRNALRVVGLHEGDYVSCLTFVDEYETIVKPRYACYEFTLGEKTIGSHHGSRSGYLVPLLCAVAFILHVFIAVVHHIKAKNYAQKLLHRFTDVTRKSNRTQTRIDVEESLRQLDHPHLSASVQRRLSRVSIDPEMSSHHNDSFMDDTGDDELPVYILPSHHSRRVSVGTVMETIPENDQSKALDSLSSMRHLIDSTPWMRRNSRSRQNGHLHV